jgi:hypothetical protein
MEGKAMASKAKEEWPANQNEAASLLEQFSLLSMLDLFRARKEHEVRKGGDRERRG